MISEKVQLLGKGCYSDIPDEITLTSMPTASELDYVGSEDFNATMLDKILPSCVTEKIDFRKLLDIDYYWVCRCLRMINYGPYYTTNAIFCDRCRKRHTGEYRVDLTTIPCKPLPEGFTNDIVISKDEFLDFNKDIHIQLPTIQDTINYEKDKAFQSADGAINRELARICYMMKSVGNDSTINPIEAKMLIQDKMSPADYTVLKGMIDELTDYGLRAGGSTQCPVCGNPNATFIALMDDRFFRPTLGDIRQWRSDRSSGKNDIVSRNKTKAV